jgi:tryptophanyl-tRNA synthetase
MKQLLFEYLNEHIKPARAEYQRLIENPGDVEAALQQGAEKARAISVPYLDKIRHAVGIRKLG